MTTTVTKAKTVVHSLSEFMFEAQANSPETWQLCAYELIGAANLCFQRHVRVGKRNELLPLALRATSSARVTLMLYAFGIEGLLKALWLAQKNRSTTQGKRGVGRRLRDDFANHDLHGLWKRTSMPPPSEIYESWLKALTHFAELGRYPVLRKPSFFGRYVVPENAKGPCLDLATAVDDQIRRLRPVESAKLGPAQLNSLGVRSLRA